MTLAPLVGVSLPKAVLWDLDGTLIDSEEYWIQSEQELVEEFGGSWSHEDGLQLVGIGLSHTAAALQSRGVTLTNEDTVARLVDKVLHLIERNQPWRPNTLELMAQLQQHGVRQALVTMSYQKIAFAIRDLVPGQPFEVIVAGDHVNHSKPAPDAYLLAIEQLGLRPIDCLAFEDSPAGCTAASTAGVTTVGVENVVDLSEAPCFLQTHSLKSFSIATVADVYSLSRDRHASGLPIWSNGGVMKHEHSIARGNVFEDTAGDSRS